MAKSLGEFAIVMYRGAERLPGAVNAIKKQVAGDVQRACVLATPVDTGQARSNWIVTAGSPTELYILPYAPGRYLGLGESANAAAAIAQGQEIISTVLPGQTVYINQNTPYIGDLNRGTSSQAAPLFVQTAVLRAIASLDGKELKLFE